LHNSMKNDAFLDNWNNGRFAGNTPANHTDEIV
jgi:hypothetical protein